KQMAAHLLEAAAADLEFKEGKFTVAGTDRAIPMIDVAKAFFRPVGPTTKFGTGLDASGSSNVPPSFPNGCHVCEVEVDPDTGVVEIARYVVVDDVGRVINPMICHGQIDGALAQGIGQALMENVAFDAESGQMLSASFMDYAMPRATDFAVAAEMDFVDVPAKTNPLGVKGIGEAGCVGAPPAVMNAVLDALRPRGVKHLDMPATPRRVWEALQKARSKGRLIALEQPARAQISFRAASSANLAGGVVPAFRAANSAVASAGTLTITKPTNTATNHVLI